MIKTLLTSALLSLVSMVVQLLVVLSVPITGKSIGYSLHLAKYQGVVFGVFGVCDLGSDICSSARIGYDSQRKFQGLSESAIQLPSNARYSISKLLVVHVLAFASSGMVLLCTLCTLLFVWSVNAKHRASVAQESSSESGDLETVAKVSTRNDEKTIIPANVTIQLNFQLVMSMFSCLFSLLGLLSDIILFVPHLSYLGWIQIVPIVFQSIATTLMCWTRRTVFSRRHLEEEYYYANDDMRRPKSFRSRVSDDSASDDGFYVYTNGFYSNYGDREFHNQSQQSNTNSWRRHTPMTNRDDETSVNSSQLNGISNANRDRNEQYDQD
ncbi:regulator of ime2 [Yamadazyma tenuis]|uniref:Pali-domain-containing protein n=1 Tax=Candida tenuis (strain ATCC 10573 / BCRC 21748 / CBS 615 / JCM 9827 / NBRC 10315 / NRRL Y-1498 / VKM Y-70) TaxID=590646 RepID=G3BBV7_CANTC|nr:uncharacterized protein CANTEDRAFT_136591 [Yamadazyma tenuis ATCC 10573]EGV60089.1 hypothetical protein CANTEDRAFT_136591 [Yamadazyma tenuis ATCC 10573]WEJ94675.1 regulator of ime2 [Yamadazyma tenuis]